MLLVKKTEITTCQDNVSGSRAYYVLNKNFWHTKIVEPNLSINQGIL